MNRFTTPEAMQAEELRIETMAARETALRLAFMVNAKVRVADTFEILTRATVFEGFLLQNPAAGQQALEAVHEDKALLFGPINNLMDAASHFEAWLSGRTSSADLMPKLMLDAA